MSLQLAAVAQRGDLINDADLRRQSQEFLTSFRQALASGSEDINTQVWDPVRGLLGEVSRSRARQGFTPSETATFILSLKQPLFRAMESENRKDGAELLESLWTVSTLLDKLGLVTTEIFQKSRDEIINRQQRELLELSTPVVKLWEGVLALPLIGTLDSARTQIVMESLLERIVESGAEIAIIDITGVPTVDTLVAQHLIKTISAARLMGADCILSGIRPQIAQTIVHLGLELNVISKATMADALALALRRSGKTIVNRTKPVAPAEG
jgi:rsbT co-antagonist protein RsbR